MPHIGVYVQVFMKNITLSFFVCFLRNTCSAALWIPTMLLKRKKKIENPIQIPSSSKISALNEMFFFVLLN